MKTNPKVDRYFKDLAQWKEELARLRTILLECPLEEEFKWAKPCYTFQKSNLVILCGLKESCAIGFLKGVLLKDSKGVLGKPGENSQSMRWLKFTSGREIAVMKSIVKAYIQEAIDAEKAGLKVDFKESKALAFPEELKRKFKESPAFKTAFEALTPGRQRGYNLFFSAAKQAATREARIKKYEKQILSGKGMQD